MQAPRDITEVFALWDSRTDMARALDESYDTIRKWEKAKRIPERAWNAVIRAAALRERLITAADLLNLNTAQKPRPGRPPSRKSSSSRAA
jgi:cell division FtsZ-interacting protein ZapD